MFPCSPLKNLSSGVTNKLTSAPKVLAKEDENQNYAKFLAEFYESPFVDKDAWFDFGSVAKCSPVEYFGSGLWLVYKGIDHPLKAVLKILLMEAYADEYPNTRLLSMELKSAVYNGSKYSIRQDAYYLMYELLIVESLCKNKILQVLV